MFRKIAFAAVAVCALAASASATMMKVVDISNYAIQDDDGYSTAPITLKPNTVYDFNKDDDNYYYVTVQCPGPKKTGKVERAFNSYITASVGGDWSYALYVRDADGTYLGELWGTYYEGDGSQLTITCVNGRITANYNEY